MRKILLPKIARIRILRKILHLARKYVVSYFRGSWNLKLLSQHYKKGINVTDYKVKRIVYFVGCPSGESKRYRVLNLVEVMRNQGRNVDVIYEDELENYSFTADLTTAVIFRAKYTQQLKKFIQRARSENVDVIFDTDDLVFEPESLDFIGAVRKLGESEKSWHLNEVLQIRQALLMCDAATTTNEFLGSRIRQIGIRTGTVRCSLNPLQIDFARTLNLRTKIDSVTRLGFFSGSPTHQADFEEIETHLFNFIIENSNVILVIVGYLELSNKWSVLASQIEKHPFLAPLEMLKIMSEIDCLLVPLEMNNPFTNSKAEVKIFEAALVGTPVICSAIYSYSKCIENGVNGILVGDSSEWKNALSLTLNKKFLKDIGLQAKNDFVAFFSDIKATDEAIKFYSHVRSIRLNGIEEI